MYLMPIYLDISSIYIKLKEIITHHSHDQGLEQVTLYMRKLEVHYMINPSYSIRWVDYYKYAVKCFVLGSCCQFPKVLQIIRNTLILPDLV